MSVTWMTCVHLLRVCCGFGIRCNFPQLSPPQGLQHCNSASVQRIKIPNISIIPAKSRFNPQTFRGPTVTLPTEHCSTTVISTQEKAEGKFWNLDQKQLHFRTDSQFESSMFERAAKQPSVVEQRLPRATCSKLDVFAGAG